MEQTFTVSDVDPGDVAVNAPKCIQWARGILEACGPLVTREESRGGGVVGCLGHP